MKKPIDPKLHGIIDYVFASVFLLAPSVFGLKKKARRLSYLVGLNTLAVNGLSDTPVAIRRTISFNPGHKIYDYTGVAAIALLPYALGAVKQPAARNFFLAMTLITGLNVLLTDYDGDTGAAKPDRA